MAIEKKTDEQSKAIAIRKNVAMPIQSISDIQSVGAAIAQSGMFGINNAGAGLVVAMTCHSQGISLLEFSRTYHIVNGKPSMRADAMLAEYRKHGGKYVIVENSVNRAAAKFTFEGQEYLGEFTMDDAKATGDCMDKGAMKYNWSHRPADMLWARMVSRSVRRLCPEIVAGVYTPEEVEDFRGSDNAKPVQAISIEDARARQAGAAVAPSVMVSVHATEPETTDAVIVDDSGVLEIDPVTGCRFEDMSNEDLQDSWNDQRITDSHREVIAKIVEARKAVQA